MTAGPKPLRKNAMTSKEAAAMVSEKLGIKKALLRSNDDALMSRLAEIERELELFRIMN